MPASKYDFSIEQGASFKLMLTYKDSNGNIVPLTDYCVRLTWRTDIGSTQIFSSLDQANPDYKFDIDEPNGVINLLLSANYTNSLNFGSAKYDLELQSPEDLYTGGGKIIKRLLFGSISLSKRFSKTTELLDCPT
jgi:hypothetical protein